MSVGLMVITHANLAESLIANARDMLGSEPLRMAALSVGHTDDMDQMQTRAAEYCQTLDQGDGVLVLTDVFGSTPSNIACMICARHKSKIIAGVNLPMMIRVLNYPHMNLDELAEKALSGGRDGILMCCSANGSSMPDDPQRDK